MNDLSVYSSNKAINCIVVNEYIRANISSLVITDPALVIEVNPSPHGVKYADMFNPQNFKNKIAILCKNLQHFCETNFEKPQQFT